jgi:hypothetical protein
MNEWMKFPGYLRYKLTMLFLYRKSVALLQCWWDSVLKASVKVTYLNLTLLEELVFRLYWTLMYSDDYWNQTSLLVKDCGLRIGSATLLTTSVFLASSARTNNLQSRVLARIIYIFHAGFIERTIRAWIDQSGTPSLEGGESISQKSWISKCIW